MNYKRILDWIPLDTLRQTTFDRHNIGINHDFYVKKYRQAEILEVPHYCEWATEDP
jgi:hypothetical protein